jgi:hypothetical protein
MGVLKTTGSNLFTLKVCKFQYWPVSPRPAPAQLLIKSRDYLLHLPVDYDESKALAPGESVMKCQSPLNVLKDTYDHSCY